MSNIERYSTQSIDATDLDIVLTALKSANLTQGEFVEEFETSLRLYCGANHGIATTSATSALHIALLSLSVGKNHLVWTSPNSFVASANSALYCGATVDFVDIDPLTLNICPNKLKEKIIKTGTVPDVVVLVHFAGLPCDLVEFHNLKREFGFKLIEDASHALGSTYENEKIGNCKYSDITVFSFHAVKMITTGEGGMVLTNDPAVAERCQLLRSHGITRDIESFERKDLSSGPWGYEQQYLGYNYRMTELQAALGVSQLKKLDGFVGRRTEIANQYLSSIQNDIIKLPLIETQNSKSSIHLFAIHINPKKRTQLFKKLKSSGIGAQVHYIPIHYHPFYRRLGFADGDFPVSENHYETTISIPLHTGLDDDEVSRVIKLLNDFSV